MINAKSLAGVHTHTHTHTSSLKNEININNSKIVMLCLYKVIIQA